MNTLLSMLPLASAAPSVAPTAGGMDGLDSWSGSCSEKAEAKIVPVTARAHRATHRLEEGQIAGGRAQLLHRHAVLNDQGEDRERRADAKPVTNIHGPGTGMGVSARMVLSHVQADRHGISDANMISILKRPVRATI